MPPIMTADAIADSWEDEDAAQAAVERLRERDQVVRAETAARTARIQELAEAERLASRPSVILMRPQGASVNAADFNDGGYLEPGALQADDSSQQEQPPPVFKLLKRNDKSKTDLASSESGAGSSNKRSGGNATQQPNATLEERQAAYDRARERILGSDYAPEEATASEPVSVPARDRRCARSPSPEYVRVVPNAPTGTTYYYPPVAAAPLQPQQQQQPPLPPPPQTVPIQQMLPHQMIVPAPLVQQPVFYGDMIKHATQIAVFGASYPHFAPLPGAPAAAVPPQQPSGPVLVAPPPPPPMQLPIVMAPASSGGGESIHHHQSQQQQQTPPQPLIPGLTSRSLADVRSRNRGATTPTNGYQGMTASAASSSSSSLGAGGGGGGGGKNAAESGSPSSSSQFSSGAATVTQEGGGGIQRISPPHPNPQATHQRQRAPLLATPPTYAPVHVQGIPGLPPPVSVNQPRLQQRQQFGYPPVEHFSALDISSGGDGSQKQQQQQHQSRKKKS